MFLQPPLTVSVVTLLHNSPHGPFTACKCLLKPSTEARSFWATLAILFRVLNPLEPFGLLKAEFVHPHVWVCLRVCWPLKGSFKYYCGCRVIIVTLEYCSNNKCVEQVYFCINAWYDSIRYLHWHQGFNWRVARALAGGVIAYRPEW